MVMPTRRHISLYLLPCLLLLGNGLAASACKSGNSNDNGGSDFAMAPTAPTPTASCSGAPLDAIVISFYGNSAATIQVFGETFQVPAGSGQSGAPFQIRRAVVPCDYTMTGQVASPPGTTLTFLREGERGQHPGGVERGSIAFQEGPLSPGTTNTPECSVDLGADPGGDTTFRFSFRVVASGTNACY